MAVPKSEKEELIRLYELYHTKKTDGRVFRAKACLVIGADWDWSSIDDFLDRLRNAATSGITGNFVKEIQEFLKKFNEVEEGAIHTYLHRSEQKNQGHSR